jgi:cell pole-organizing protein PopZ
VKALVVTVEPRVEDLLASIRLAIDADVGAHSTSSNSQGTLMRGAIREMRVSFDKDKKADTEISELRNRITRSRGADPLLAPKPASVARTVERLVPTPTRGGISEILNQPTAKTSPMLRQTLIEEQSPYVQAQQQWEEPEYYEEPVQDYYQPAYQPPPQPALIAPQTAQAAQNSFQHLADSIMARASGDRGIENMTRDLLQGMLKNWLDDNLPDLVERLVREEIERVARRGR